MKNPCNDKNKRSDCTEHKFVESNHKAYFLWILLAVFLTSGAFLSIMAMENSDIIENPQGLLLLKVCWGGFAVDIISGVTIVYCELQAYLDSETTTKSITKTIIRIAHKLFFLSSVISLISFLGFIVMNL